MATIVRVVVPAGPYHVTYRKSFGCPTFPIPSAKFNWRFDKAEKRLNQQIGTAARVERVGYSVNNMDQMTAVISGGPLHVSGQLDRLGLVDSVDGPVPTASMSGFWIGLFEPTTLGRGTLPLTITPSECPPPPFTYLTNPPDEN